MIQKNDNDRELAKKVSKKPTLGLKALVRVETKVSGGCGKHSTTNCGIGYRAG